VSSIKGFNEFVMSLTSYLKSVEVTGLFTSTTSELLGGTSVTEAHISSITDTIFLLRYVELQGEMRRGIMVLKMRGSQHDKNIRVYIIDENFMHIKEPFRNVGGILSGSPVQYTASEINTMGGMFGDNT
jgi:circadian clock protein KaiC